MDDSGRPTDSKKVRQKLLLYLLIDVCVNELHMIRLCNSSRPAEPSGPFPRLQTHHQSSCSLCFMSLLSLLSRLLRVVTFKFRSLLLEEEASSSSSPLEMTTIKRCSPFPPMLFQASFVCHSWAHVFSVSSSSILIVKGRSGWAVEGPFGRLFRHSSLFIFNCFFIPFEADPRRGQEKNERNMYAGSEWKRLLF